MRISDWSSDVCSSDLQTIVALALAPDEQLTGAPVDIIEPDGDHLRCPQPKARHHQQHCMIAQTMLRIVADPCEQGFDLLGRQEARKSRVPALGYGRHAKSKVGLRDAPLEKLTAEGAHVGGSRLVAIDRKSTRLN